jgi:hypothetical protein
VPILFTVIALDIKHEPVDYCASPAFYHDLSARMFSNKICHNITAHIYFHILRGIVEFRSFSTSDGRYHLYCCGSARTDLPNDLLG